MRAEVTRQFFPAIERAHKDRIASAKRRTQLYDIRSLQGLGNFVPKFDKPCPIVVEDSDSFDAARELIAAGMRPLVLNMASEQRPGGGWRKGSMAQEEALFYRSTYALLLEPHEREWYPMEPHECIFTPDVHVFLDRWQQPLKEPFWVDCIALPGLRRPRLANDRLLSRDEALVEAKIRALLNIAVEQNCDALVLGALGCGAFHNPPEHIAEIFARALSGDAVRKSFRHISFAVLGVGAAGLSNLRVFRQALETL